MRRIETGAVDSQTHTYVRNAACEASRSLIQTLFFLSFDIQVARGLFSRKSRSVSIHGRPVLKLSARRDKQVGTIGTPIPSARCVLDPRAERDI